jgi:hypothetical protein
VKSDPRAQTLATAVAARDLAGLGEQLTDDVRLRALLPGGPIEENGRGAVLATFDGWFGGYDTVVLEDAAGELVGDRLLVHYRLVFEPDAERRALTQTWVSTVAADGRLARIDLVCSGFREF